MRAIVNFWRRNFLSAEFLAALLVLVGAIVWSERFGGLCTIEKLLGGNRGPIYSALASIFGSLLGFVITAASIVITAAGSERMAIVRNSPHYETLWKVFTQTIWCLAFATITALIALVLDRDSKPNTIAFYFCIGGVLFAIVRMYRCLWIMEKIILLFTKSRI